MGQDPVEQFTFPGVARNNRPDTVVFGERAFPGVEAEVGLPVFLVGAMAIHAAAGQNRADVTVKPDGLFGECIRTGDGNRDQSQESGSLRTEGKVHASSSVSRSKSHTQPQKKSAAGKKY